MRIGILADIHEDLEALALALDRLRREQVDQIVVLGDIFDTGQRVEPTVELLADAGVIGVWGNHDLGLCHEPSERTRGRYAARVFAFTQTLHPRLEVGGCLFCHGLPSWDATDPAIYYLGARPETQEGRTEAFQASPCRVTFVGHYHRWLVTTPEEILSWDGDRPVLLRQGQRFLVVIAAVCDGWCAVYDTGDNYLVPLRCRDEANHRLGLPDR